jgi:hypothetical protein
VQNLLMNREFPVDCRTSKYFFATLPTRNLRGKFRRKPSYGASLVYVTETRRIHAVPQVQSSFLQTNVPDVVHRFEESIAGRVYQIEVAPVSCDRWRACIVRRPGVPTALMPFYGATPNEAAHQLTQWLTRAYQQAAT